MMIPRTFSPYFYIILIAGNLIWGYSSFAQQYVFKYLNVKDGLPSDYVTSLYFDRSGFLWIGTDKGICRYSGSEIQTLTVDDGLYSNLVYTIIQDDKGDIWAGTNQGGGLNHIVVTGNKIRVSDVKHTSLTFYLIKRDRKGVYYLVGRKNGSDKYFLWKTSSLDKPLEEIASFNHANTIDVDATGTIYYSANQQIDWRNISNPRIAVAQGDDSAQVLCSGDRIAVLQKDVTYIIHPKGRDTLPFRRYYEYTGANHVRYLAVNGQDFFYKTGVYDNYIYSNGRLTNIVNDGLSDKNFFFLFTAAADRYGQLFLSHFGKGILIWKSPYLRHYDVKNRILRIKSHEGSIYFNSEKAIYRIIEKVRKPESLTSGSGKQFSFFFHNPFNELITGDGSFFHYIKSQKRIYPYQLLYDHSDALVMDDQLFISSYSNGISKINANGTPDKQWNKRIQLPTSTIERLYKSPNGFYALTLSKGLLEINPQDTTVKIINKQSGLLSSSVYSIFNDSNQTWIGTSMGVSLLTQDSIKNFDATSGFIGTRSVCIFRDNASRLWVLSDKFLHLYKEGRLYAIRSYPVIDANQSYISTAFYQKESNKLWVGTDKELLELRMERVIPLQNTHHLQIGTIRVNEKLVNHRTGFITLGSAAEKIEIQFAHPHLSTFSRPVIYVRLKDYDDNWKILDKDNIFSFGRLPHGNYKVEVKTEGPDLGTIPAIHLLKIEVLPPWWRSNLFLSICFLAAAIVAFVIGRRLQKKKFALQLSQLKQQQAIELERVRISRELHDNVGSMLTLIINRLDDSATEKEFNSGSISIIAKKTLSQLRDAIWALDKHNLTLGQWINKVKDYLRQFSSDKMIIKVEIHWPSAVLLTPGKALHLFRIMQEAINNAIKHSGANTILVNGVEATKGLYKLSVLDNGIGFNSQNIKKGYGLRNMQKRAVDMGATLQIENHPDGGTLLSLIFSLDE